MDPNFFHRRDNSGASQRQWPHAGEILEMIADEAVAKEINIKKIEHRKKCDDEVGERESNRSQGGVAFVK